MQLQAWDASTEVTFDKRLTVVGRADVAPHSRRRLHCAHYGTGRCRKSFPANALGRIAARRGHSVHAERADNLFKQLKAVRLDGSYDEEMRKLHRVDLLVLELFALHRLEATETKDFYEIMVERHRQVSTIVTTNRTRMRRSP